LSTVHKCTISDSMMLCKYINQLQDIAFEKDIRLKDMFVVAGIPTSTYYRAMNGVDLRFDTAERVANAIRDVQVSSNTSASRS